MTTPAARDLASLTPAQRCHAARRLARGTPSDILAAQMGLDRTALAEGVDPAFDQLIRWYAAQAELSKAEQDAQLLDALRDAVMSRLEAEGDPSGLGWAVRLVVQGVPPAARQPRREAVPVPSNDNEPEDEGEAAVEAKEPDVTLPADAPPDLFPPDTPSHVQAFLLGLLDGKSREEREQFYALRSIEAFEAWEAKQPEPEPCDVSEEELALVRWATRHNPPWCYGPPPGEAVERPACLGPEPVLPANDVRPSPKQVRAELKARLASLLDRTAPKDLSDLDLAHAVCAVLWPKYPAYEGPVDPWALRDVLQEVRVDTPTLHWLESREFGRLCHEGERKKAQGP